jgi:hypothetical protein
MTGAIGMMFGNRTPPAAAGGAGDAPFSDVQLLLSGGETNNSTTVKDYSNNNWGSWTTSASFKYSNAQAKFASTSLFLGTGADIRRAWVGTNLAFPAYASSGETGDWTIEMWIYPVTYAGGIMAQHTFGPLLLLFNGNGTVYHEMGATGGGTTGEFSTTTALTQNAWNHFAITRKNNTNTAWINGSSAGTATSTVSQRTVQYGGNPDAYEIGSFNGTGSNKLNAYIEDFRYTKGKARYTAAFSPPTASFPKS